MGFYAIDAALYAKAPPTLLADPGKLLAFFQRSSKTGQTWQILSGDIEVRDGGGKFEAQVAEKVVLGDLTRFGFFVSLPAVHEDEGRIHVRHEFKWNPDPKVRGGHGVSDQDRNRPFPSMRCVSQTELAKGGATLAAEWRSAVPPPDVKPGGQWHYLIFYSLP